MNFYKWRVLHQSSRVNSCKLALISKLMLILVNTQHRRNK